MKTKLITYSKLFSLGNFQNEKIEVTAELEPGETAQDAVEKLRDFVLHNHQLSKSKEQYLHCHNIIADTENNTGREINQAREFIRQYEKMQAETPKLIGA